MKVFLILIVLLISPLTALEKWKASPLSPGIWRAVPYKEGYYPASVTRVDGDSIEFRIFDVSLPVEEWPFLTVDTSSIKLLQKDSTETLEELIAYLKENHYLVSSNIENAMRQIDRNWFCSDSPYFDGAINVGHKSCISSPHIHALALGISQPNLSKAKKILDVGCGTGYLTAVFASLSPEARVFGMECMPELAECAKETINHFLPQEVSSRISFLVGDGEKGCPEEGPYDIIHVGFMCHNIPEPLLDQLAIGGYLLIPVGHKPYIHDDRCLAGEYYFVKKESSSSFKIINLFGCAFVPSISHPLR